jgi:hypothetical protein
MNASDFIQWLQELGADSNPEKAGFNPQAMYVVVCVVLPVTIGLFVGFGLRAIERIFGIQVGHGGGH